MLPPERAGADADHDVVDDHHDGSGNDQRPRPVEDVEQRARENDGRGDLAQDAEQHRKIHVAGPVVEDSEQALRAASAVLGEFFDTRGRDAC